jgi:hypothetical protein
MYDKYLKKLRTQLSEKQIVFNSEKSGWKTRNRRLDLFGFLNLFISQRPNNHLSLNQMRQELLFTNGLLSKEGINKRINAKASTMLKQILHDLLSINLRSTIDSSVTNRFRSIILTDSTCFQLPSRLNEAYKGFGGNHGMRGGVKVQYQMSLTDGQVKMSTGSASVSDQKSTIIQPNKEELHLFDLGYFSFDRLNEFDQKSAYYLCRLKLNTLLWVRKNDQWQRLTWKEIVKMHKGNETLEIEVCLGKERRVKTRLFIERISKQAAAEKRRTVKRYAERHGRNPTQKQLIACDFSVHISNIPNHLLGKENVRKMYSLRWQIEIQFKTWKSFMNIDKIYHVNQHRFECHHYGSLIYILLLGKVFFEYKQTYWQENQVELSELKAMKFLAQNAYLIWSCIFDGKEDADFSLKQIHYIFETTCVKEGKKHRETPMNIMKTCLS